MKRAVVVTVLVLVPIGLLLTVMANEARSPTIAQARLKLNL